MKNYLLSAFVLTLPLNLYAMSNNPVSIQLIQTAPAYATIEITNHSLDAMQVNYSFTGNHHEVNLTSADDLNYPTNCAELLPSNTCAISLHSVNNPMVGNVDQGQLTVSVVDQGNAIKNVSFNLNNQTDLYAGGAFTYAYNASGAPVNVNHIAKWDGTNWSALGSYVLDGQVNAFTVGKDGTLYVGGQFKNAGGVIATNIANWNPVVQRWTALGSGIGPVTYAVVNTLATGADGAIYVGGNFSQAGGIPASYLARWDGTSWSSLGSFFSSPVYSLAAGKDGLIYAGVDSQNPSSFVSWNPATQVWSFLPSTSQGVVGKLVNFTLGKDGSIFIAGNFDYINANAAIGQWNSASQQFYPIGGNTILNGSPIINALAIGSDGIYIGGRGLALGTTPNNILAWNGAAWTTLGTGVNGQVFVLTADANGSIYAGGYFTAAGGNAASFIALWNPSTHQWLSLAKGFNAYVSALILAPSLQITQALD